MMNSRHTTLCASAAIAAALTLTPAAGLAQAAPAPVTPVPEVTAPPPASLPAAQAPIMTSSPVVQPIPEPPPVVEEAEPAATPAARTTTTTTRQAAQPRPASAAPAPAPEPLAAEAESVTASEAEPIAAAPLAAPDATPAEARAPAATGTWSGVLLPAVIGGLAVLALAIWGFVAIGRRKPVERRAATLERPLPKPAVARVLAEPIVAQPVTTEPVVAEPVHDRVTPIGPARTSPEASLAHTGAAVPLPRKMPESFAERDALLNRMVAAKPDRANPFTSPLQRRRRAKLILQSLGRDFGDVEPWIDLSQYPQNWPELARDKHAAA